MKFKTVRRTITVWGNVTRQINIPILDEADTEELLRRVKHIDIIGDGITLRVPKSLSDDIDRLFGPDAAEVSYMGKVAYVHLADVCTH